MSEGTTAVGLGSLCPLSSARAEWIGTSLGAVGMLGITGGALLGSVLGAGEGASVLLGVIGVLEVRGAVLPGPGGCLLKASILAS